jgi:glycosyltransferase involved in cell wall biosynthesis
VLGAGERVARAAGRYAKKAARAVGRLGRGASLTVVGPPRDRPRVFYGFTRVPRTSAGGIVKVQRMQSRFPNAPWRFNVLYLVSSRLPPDASALVRLGRAHGVPLVLNQNGVAYPAWHGPGWEATNAPIARALTAAAHVFYQSEFCKLSADRFLGAPTGTWEVLHNAVDTDVFTPRSSRIAGPLTLLVAGTQDLRYRVSVALEVLALVLRSRADVRMVITGRLRWAGNARQATMDAQGMAAALGVADRVVFAGPYTQDDAPVLYRRGHVLLHAKYNDPSPGVVPEAMACGLPVVFSASGGVPELVGSDAGIGVPAELSWERDIPPDPAAMADAVLRVTERLSDFSEAARQRAVQRFDMRRWLARHADVLSDIVRNKHVAVMAQGTR